MARAVVLHTKGSRFKSLAGHQNAYDNLCYHKNMETKTCNACSKTKPLSDFHYSNSGSGKRKSKCKECQAKYFQEYRAKNTLRLQEKWRDASKRYHSYDNRRLRTLRKYNLTLDEYNDILESQDNKCLICKRKMALVIDHDHETGVVRGLLCNACNLAIGYFEDSTERLESAVKYINAGKRNGNSRLS